MRYCTYNEIYHGVSESSALLKVAAVPIESVLYYHAFLGVDYNYTQKKDTRLTWAWGNSCPRPLFVGGKIFSGKRPKIISWAAKGLLSFIGVKEARQAGSKEKTCNASDTAFGICQY